MLYLMTKLEIQVEGDDSGRSHPLQMGEVTRAGGICSASEWNREAKYLDTLASGTRPSSITCDWPVHVLDVLD